MRFYLLLALIPLGAYMAAAVAAALGVSMAWPRLRVRIATASAGERARQLACIRLLPITAGVLASTLIGTVFLRYEPRETNELPGLTLLVLAGITLVLSGGALWHALRSWRASAACSRLLRQTGRQWIRDDGTGVWVIDTAYPVAAVTGLFRTRLLLSTRIMRECTPLEIEAVIRHEAAHVRRRDNVVRAAMQCLPDPLALLPAGREIQDRWAAAAEEAADDEAAGPRPEARTELAAALVRVARMADGQPPAWMPALAFYEGTHLEHRVRRLLSPGTGPAPASARRLIAVGCAIAAGAILMTEDVSFQIHTLMELAVQHLP